MSKRVSISQFRTCQRGSWAVDRAPRFLPDVARVFRCSRSRIVYLLVANFVLAAAGLLALAPPALADLSTVPDDTVEADGRVSAIVRAGDRVYLGGSFTQLTDKGGTIVARNNLAAIDANTGEIVTDWNPNANGSVRAMVLSEDGNRLYIGGTFTNVGDLARNRLAAVDLATGTIDRRWNAGTNGTVRALAVSANRVYLGGDFSTVKGVSRTHLARVDGTTGALDPNWSPSADQIHSVYGSVRALAFSEDGSRLYAGGYFGSISGQQTGNLVALDTTTGAVDSGFRPNDSNGILCLVVSDGRVFAGTGDNLEGIEAFDASTGQRDWYLGYGSHTSPEGDVQAMTIGDGTLYAGGHFTKMHDQVRNRLVAVDAATGIIDSQWTPKANGGNLGVWAMAWYGTQLYVGGDFTSISGREQERFAQFTEGPDQPLKGVTGEYFDNVDFTGTQMTRTDATIDYDWGSFSPPGIGPNTFSARWSGQVSPRYSETYTFYTTSDDGVRLWVNGQLIINNWTDHAPTENSGQITLTAEQKYDVRMEYYENGGGAVAKLKWSSVSQPKGIVPQGRLYPQTSDSQTFWSEVAPKVTVTGPATARNGTTKAYEFTVTNPGEDTFAFAANYPQCGKGGKLTGSTIEADGGRFRCKFVRAPAKTAVAIRVRDSDEDISNVARQKVRIKKERR
jgi:hypothetical protein